MNISSLLMIVLFLSFSYCDQKSAEQQIKEGLPELKTETIVTGYEVIWGMDFLPSGDMIFTERKGNIYIKRGDKVTTLSGFPPVLVRGQGGLLDVKVHPGYKDNGWIYASYSSEGSEGKARMNLIRFKILNDQVTDIGYIFSTDASNSWFGHFGSRIEIDSENHLFLSIGEGGSTTYAGPAKKNNNAQETGSPWGKIHRLMDDGTIPADNPVLRGSVSPSSVFSYGHRNPQGMAFNPGNHELWISEHGPKGGDEINIIKKGANYGWPDYSLGVNYDGSKISDGHTAEGITAPVFSWNPSIGTCGMTFIKGKMFGAMEGDLLVAGLVTGKLHRLVIKDGTITETRPFLTGLGRVRDVAQGPDGSIYISAENPGRIIRVTPK